MMDTLIRTPSAEAGSSGPQAFFSAQAKPAPEPTRWAGIDCGKTGAIAVLARAADSQLRVCALSDMPLRRVEKRGKGMSEIDTSALAALLFQILAPTDTLVIESPLAGAGQDVRSVFSIGQSYGEIRGVCFALMPSAQIKLVTPAKWKRDLGVSSDKRSSLAKATELIPSGAALWTRQKDHGRAEAALLAYWGLQTFGAEDVN